MLRQAQHEEENGGLEMDLQTKTFILILILILILSLSKDEDVQRTTCWYVRVWILACVGSTGCEGSSASSLCPQGINMIDHPRHC